MSKKTKNPESVIRKILTDAFFRYHLNKMSLTEFIIRFLRVDMVNKGVTGEKLDLLKLIRNYQRGIEEKCKCPDIEDLDIPPKKKTLREYLIGKL